MSRLGLIFTLVLAVFIGQFSPVMAQTTTTPPSKERAVTNQELESLVSTLEDPAARDRFVSQLKTALNEQQKKESAEPETLGVRAFQYLSDTMTSFGHEAVALGSTFLDTPRALKWLNKQFSDRLTRERWARLVAELAFSLAAGFTAHGVANYLLRRTRRYLKSLPDMVLWRRIPFVLLGFLIDLIPIIVFALSSVGVLTQTDPPTEVKSAANAVIMSTVIVHLLIAVTSAFLSPSAPNLRLMKTVSDETAHYLVIWTRRISLIAAYGYYFTDAARILGLPVSSYHAILKTVGFVVTGMFTILLLQNRAVVSAWLRGSADGKGEDVPKLLRRTPANDFLRVVRRRLADVWHILAIIYIVVIYGIWALDVEGGFFYMIRATVVTLVVLAMTRGLLKAIHRGLAETFSLSDDIRTLYPNLEQRANLYLPLLERTIRVVLWLLAAAIILTAWGIDSLGLLETPLGQRIVSGGVSIITILAIAITVWEIVSLGIERYLTGTDPAGNKVERSARVRTLLPLFRNALAILLVTLVGLITLSELGFDIAPLLAGAGVIGLAVGFGSQALVKDLITGLFYLLEDTIAVGDVVDVGSGHVGSVESISIRTIRLRDYAGAVHTIPFGEVKTVTNMTKDFSFAVFDIGIAYHEDVERVMTVMQEVATVLQEDPERGWKILSPLEIAGLHKFDESAIIIRGRFKTRPGNQWEIARAYHLLLKKRFDVEGIEIPFPYRTVVFANPPTSPITMPEAVPAIPAPPQEVKTT